MKLSVFCLFIVIIPSWTQEDYCWPHNIQVCRHFLVSSLVTASVLFGYFGFGYCMFNFVGVWNCRNWKSQPSSKFKICNFPCHPYHLHFTLGWENSKPPLQNKCRLRSYLKRLCSCPCSHIAERGHWRPISIFRQVSLSALAAKWSLMSVLWRILLGGSKRYW